MIVQINGKVRGTVEVSNDADQSEVEKLVLMAPEILKWVQGKKVQKTIFVKNRVINFMVEE